MINLSKIKNSLMFYNFFFNIKFFLPFFLTSFLLTSFLISDDQIEFLSKLEKGINRLNSYSFEIVVSNSTKRDKLEEKYKFYYLHPGYEMLKGVVGYCTGTVIIKHPDKGKIFVKKGKYKQKISKDDERIKDFFETSLKNYVQKLYILSKTAKISIEEKSEALKSNDGLSDDNNPVETYYVLNIYPPSNLEEITRYEITFKSYKYKDLVINLPYKEEIYGYEKSGGFLSLFVAPSKMKKEILYSSKNWTKYSLDELLTSKDFSF